MAYAMLLLPRVLCKQQLSCIVSRPLLDMSMLASLLQWQKNVTRICEHIYGCP
jgi:hypothetical protein